MSGKGSTRRPRFVPLADLAARWDATFGKMRTFDVQAIDAGTERYTQRPDGGYDYEFVPPSPLSSTPDADTR